MRWLVNYLRQCFCKHELEFEEGRYCGTEFGIVVEENTVVSQTCKKCGYHKSYKKFR